MLRSPIDEFLAYELNDVIRSELVRAIEQTRSGRLYFTYNTFNVSLNFDTSVVTVEDELDVSRQSTLSLDQFTTLLDS